MLGECIYCAPRLSVGGSRSC